MSLSQLSERTKNFHTEVYLPHLFDLMWTPRYQSAARYYLPAMCKRILYDYSSGYKHKASTSLCCQRYRTTNVEVSVVDHDADGQANIINRLRLDKRNRKMISTQVTFRKKKIDALFFYTPNKQHSRIQNIAEDHCMKMYSTNNISQCVVTPQSTAIDFDDDHFSDVALTLPWVFSISDNCPGQYRDPRHLFQIACRGFKHKHLSTHTFCVIAHGKGQSDALSGTEKAAAKSLESQGHRLNSH